MIRTPGQMFAHARPTESHAKTPSDLAFHSRFLFLSIARTNDYHLVAHAQKTSETRHAGGFCFCFVIRMAEAEIYADDSTSQIGLALIIVYIILFVRSQCTRSTCSKNSEERVMMAITSEIVKEWKVMMRGGEGGEESHLRES